MANAIATAFIQLQADMTSLDKTLATKLPASINKASKNAKVKPGVDMAGMSSQIRTGLPALDRILILGGSKMGTSLGNSIGKAFGSSSYISDISKTIAKGQVKWEGAYDKMFGGKSGRAPYIHSEDIYKGVNAACAIAEVSINRVKSHLSTLMVRIRQIGPALAAAFAVGAISLMKLGAQSEVVNAKLKAMVGVTGEIAGKSVADLDLLAKKLQYVSGASEDVIKGAEGILLSFIDIRGDIFNRTLKSAQDLSSLLGTDLKSSILQLGKAISDPTAQLGALTRSGVTFTEEQKKQIKNAQALGDLYKAQSMTLDIIEAQSKGVAEAVGKTLAGSWSYASENTKEAAGTLGEYLSKALLIPQLLRGFGNSMGYIQSYLEGSVTELEKIYKWIGGTSLEKALGTTDYQGLKKRFDGEKEITNEIEKQLKLLTGTGFDSISKMAQQMAIDSPIMNRASTSPIHSNPNDQILTVGESVLLKEVIASQNRTIEAIYNTSGKDNESSPFYGF